jgi:hypothetical protein
MITLLLVVCSGLMFGQNPSQDNATITVFVFQDTSSTDGVVSGYADTLTFGTNPAGTLCLDAGLETELPPKPPAGVFDVRFTDEFADTPCMGQGSSSNFQAYAGAGNLNEFGFTIQNGDGTVKSVKLSWDHNAIVKYYTNFVVTNDAGITADMTTVDSVVFTRTQYLNKFLFFRADFQSAVKEISNMVPTAFALNQNYPNPFNPSTTIKFAIAKSALTDIAVYDVVGRRIATLASEELNPGTYSVTWNGTDNNGVSVASGVYYVRMLANGSENVNFSQVQKLLLMK